MITIESFSKGGKDASVSAATRVLIKSAKGNPLALVAEYEDGAYIVAHCEDPDWEELLATFGMTPSLVRTAITPQS